MLIPERELLLYPFEIIVASAVYVGFSLLVFQRKNGGRLTYNNMEKDRPKKAVSFFSFPKTR